MQKSQRLFALASIAVLIWGATFVNAQTVAVQAPETKTAVLKRTVSQPTAVPNESVMPEPAPNLTSGISETFANARVIRAPLEPVEFDPTLNHEIFEDFVNGSGYTQLEKINQLASAGGGTGQGWHPGPVYEDAWGVIQANHGTGTYSRLDLVGKSNNMYGVAVGIGTAYEYQVRFNLANLSNATNRYIAFDGFFDSDTLDPTFYRGILFRYSDDINDGKFQVVVRAAEGVETLVDTGIAPNIDTWYRLKISVNAAGTEALFYIDGVLVAAVTTNLAVGTANRYTAESNTDRLTGNTSFISRRFDYVRFRATSGRNSRL